jgi:hypothetical protein
MIHEPAVLIEGVLFRARYLGSTQLVCEGQPTKTTRMTQAEEAVSRIKVRPAPVLCTYLLKKSLRTNLGFIGVTRIVALIFHHLFHFIITMLVLPLFQDIS